MPDLTPENVKALANAIGLTIQETELLEITHRLNVIVSGVDKFSYSNLDAFGPTFFPALEGHRFGFPEPEVEDFGWENQED